MERDPAFNELLEVYASGESLLYAGSGIPAMVGLPTFFQLAQGLAERLRARKVEPGTLKHIEELLRSEPLFDSEHFFVVLTVAHEELGGAEFTAFIRRSLDDSHRELPEFARAVAALGPRLHAVLTTNLGWIFERAFHNPEAGPDWHVIRRLTPEIGRARKFILKLHGSLEEPSSWVLRREDYSRAMYREPDLEPAFRALLRGRPMIFVASGMYLTEPPLKQLIEHVRGDGVPRFALVREDFITPSARRAFGDAGIKLVGYPNERNTHDGLLGLLHDLRDEAPKVSSRKARPLKPPIEQERVPAEEGDRPSSPRQDAAEATPRRATAQGTRFTAFRLSKGLQRVMDVALQIRAQRQERGAELTSSALMFALLEAGRRELQPIEPSSTRWLFGLAAPERYEREFTDYIIAPFSYTQRPLDEVAGELHITNRSPNVLNLFPTAATVARRVSSDELISTRHLVGALLAERAATRVSSAIKRLTRITGLDIAGLRTAFLSYVEAHHPDEDREAWRTVLLGRMPPAASERLVPGFSPDDTHGVDLLDLQDEIAGFASVIAARDLVPPLSIGLFGSWGSGKSFFMKQLRENIDTLAGSASREESGSARFCRSIVSVEFNAWHYAEANLWASLVDHIFQCLSDHLLGKAKAEEEKVAALFQHLETSRQLLAEAEREKKRASQEQSNAETELANRVRAEQARASSLKTLLSRDLWKNVTLDILREDDRKKVDAASERLGLPALQRSARELKAVVEASKTIAGRTRLLASSLLLRSRPAWVLIAFALALPALVAAAYAASHTDVMRTVASLVGSVSLWLGGTVAWVKRQFDKTSSILDALQGAEKAVTEKLEEAEKVHRGEIAAAEALLEQAKVEVSLAERRLEQAQERVRAAELALEESRPERRIARFIQERVSSDDYRKHLGVVAMVRRDFQRLSELMYPPPDEGAPPRPPLPEGLPRIDRIVLFIDDLDRCPPQRVVEVLEAVHLLLAFKLFVVVVGVDSRWMLRSLVDRYPGLIADGTEPPSAGTAPSGMSASSLDYLEKIFQIPFWLRPMEPHGAFQLMMGLLSSPSEQAPSQQQDSSGDAQVLEAVPDSGRQHGAPAESESVARPDAARPSAGADAPVDGSAAVLPVKTADAVPPPDTEKAPPAAPPPKVQQGGVASAARRLDIHYLEIEFMEGLAPFIGGSPRRVKRFVNIYRLFKASLSPEERATFIKRGNVSGHHRPVLVLLALLTGAPRVMPSLLRQLQALPKATLLRDLMNSLKDESSAEHPLALGALDYYVQAEGEDVTLHDLVHWAARVSRYSFAAAPTGGEGPDAGIVRPTSTS